jgi:hypothetical protein
MAGIVLRSADDAVACIVAFVNRMLDSFERAADDKALRRYRHRVGRRILEERHLGPGLEGLIRPAFGHMPLLDDAPPDLTIYCCELESTGFDPGPMPWHRDVVGPQGEIVSLAGTNLRASWDPEGRTVQVIDHRRRAGFVLVESHRYFRSWERGFPLRNILHWWAASTSGQLIHAGALGRPDGGVLLLGAGGAGKSTTTLASLGSALRIAGDDFNLVDTAEPVTVHSLYSGAKLADAARSRFPDLAGRLGEPDGRIEEKSLYFLDRMDPRALIEQFPLKALLALEVADAPDTHIAPIPAAAALQACAPNTMFLLPGDREVSFRKLARLTRSRPCYRLMLGRDLEQIPLRIGELLDRL